VPVRWDRHVRKNFPLPAGSNEKTTGGGIPSKLRLSTIYLQFELSDELVNPASRAPLELLGQRRDALRALVARETLDAPQREEQVA
jgi:hypothetical protein